MVCPVTHLRPSSSQLIYTALQTIFLMIKFRVHAVPTPKGRPRFANRGKFTVAYTDKKTRDAEENFIAQSIKYKPETPLENALKLHLVFATIKPKSKPKKVVHWTTRPDLDNFIKLVKDSLNKIFWNDDSQIVEVHAKKIYDTECYTDVHIEQIPNRPVEQRELIE